MTRFVLALVVLALVTAACSSGATPTPIGGAPIDLAAVERLLTGEDIERVGASPDGLEARAEDISEVVAMVDPNALQGVDAWFSRSLTSPSRPGVIMAVRRFDDPARALAELDAVLTGGAFGSMDAPIGDRSAILHGGDGGGTSVAFVSARTYVVLQAPEASDGTVLLDAAQLARLAEMIEGRL